MEFLICLNSEDGRCGRQNKNEIRSFTINTFLTIHRVLRVLGCIDYDIWGGGSVLMECAGTGIGYDRMLGGVPVNRHHTVFTLCFIHPSVIKQPTLSAQNKTLSATNDLGSEITQKFSTINVTSSQNYDRHLN